MSHIMHSKELCWETATAIPPIDRQIGICPQGMLVEDSRDATDRVAVVYLKGNPPPEITIREVSGSVHTVLADGVAVAVVARAAGPAVSIDEVLLVEQAL